MAIEGYCNACGIEVGTDLTTKFGNTIPYKTSRSFVQFEGGVRCKPCWYKTPLATDDQYEQ